MNVVARHGEAGRQPAEDGEVRGAPRHRWIASRAGQGSAAVCTAVMLAVIVAVGTGPAAGPEIPGLAVAGIAQDPCHPQVALPVRPALTGHFGQDSSVLITARGIYVAPGEVVPLTAAESACAAAETRAGQSWLSTGLVPGVTRTQRSMAARALLDLRLAVRPDGAGMAGWEPGWEYAWPRDSSWVAVALADTGHAGRWPEGRVCRYCYLQARLRTGTCAGCGALTSLPGLNASGQPACPRCSGIPARFRCGCGREVTAGERGRCWWCVLAELVTDALAGPGGQVPARLRSLADGLMSMRRPQSGVVWLRRSAIARETVRDLARDRMPCSHAALDAAGTDRAMEYLRLLLVRYAALPPRDRRLADF
jgi:hypothetical protein